MGMTTDDIVAYTREWAIDKIEEAELCGDKIVLLKFSLPTFPISSLSSGQDP